VIIILIVSQLSRIMDTYTGEFSSDYSAKVNILENIEEKYFIHFNSSQELKQFIDENRSQVGDVCCGGKGAQLIGIKSNSQINKLKRIFLKKNRQTPWDKYEYSYECPVCLESLKYNTRYPLSCTHNVCNNCITTIKIKNNINNSCPMCRTPF
jgi:hypothetical protein